MPGVFFESQDDFRRAAAAITTVESQFTSLRGKDTPWHYTKSRGRGSGSSGPGGYHLTFGVVAGYYGRGWYKVALRNMDVPQLPFEDEAGGVPRVTGITCSRVRFVAVDNAGTLGYQLDPPYDVCPNGGYCEAPAAPAVADVPGTVEGSVVWRACENTFPDYDDEINALELIKGCDEYTCLWQCDGTTWNKINDCGNNNPSTMTCECTSGGLPACDASMNGKTAYTWCNIGAACTGNCTFEWVQWGDDQQEDPKASWSNQANYEIGDQVLWKAGSIVDPDRPLNTIYQAAVESGPDNGGATEPFDQSNAWTVIKIQKILPSGERFTPFWSKIGECLDDWRKCNCSPPTAPPADPEASHGLRVQQACLENGLCTYVVQTKDMHDQCCLFVNLDEDPDSVARQDVVSNENGTEVFVKAYQISRVNIPTDKIVLMHPFLTNMWDDLPQGSDGVQEEHYAILDWEKEALGLKIPGAIECCPDGSIKVTQYDTGIVEGLACDGIEDDCPPE